MIKNYIMKNLKRSVELALTTNSRKGQANDDIRSFVQSVVISSMKSTQQHVEDQENGVFVPSSTQLADTIGIPTTSFIRIRKLNQSKRDLLQLQGGGNSDSNSILTGTIFSSCEIKRMD